MNILKAVNLRKIYGQGETEVKALDGVNLEVEKGEFVAIVGTSGSGKSTMLHMIGGLDNPTSGQVIVDGQNLNRSVSVSVRNVVSRTPALAPPIARP